MYQRDLSNLILSRFYKGKAIIILGPRQTGKTTITNSITSKIKKEILFLNADELNVRESLTNVTVIQLKQLIGTAKIVVIDEAQRIVNIGITLKLIVDNIKAIQLLVTGSSSLDLLSEINEPLTGRKYEYNLFPISWSEYRTKHHFIEAQASLENRLIFGMYPDVLNNIGNEIEVLSNLANSYLYKDLLNFKGIRKPELLAQLLKALALQVGNQVSYNELAQLLKVDKETIANYIDLLEKSFVVFKLPSFNRNLRNELSKSKKIYFYDNGIRNAIIKNYNSLSNRNDVGALWENFLIAERMKKNSYKQNYCTAYFWRNHNQQEIDYIEEKNGGLYAYEFKWKEKPNYKFPANFVTTYKPVESKCVSAANFEEFIM